MLLHTNMIFHALDIETSSTDARHPEYALQPWRPECTVDLVILDDAPIQPFELMNIQMFIWTWNGIFDIACLIAKGVPCDRIQWLDAMSVVKWVIRSQKTDPPYETGERFSWSLENCARVFLKNWGCYDEFMTIKEHVKTSSDYWRRRCELDVKATLLLGTRFYAALTKRQQKSFLIEQQTLYPMAKAWMDGCYYDFQKAQELEDDLQTKSDVLRQKLELTKTVLDSPNQLSVVVYDQWGVPFDEAFKTKKGRSIGKAALTFAIERHGQQFPKLILLKEYREHLGRINKFIKGPLKCREYLGSEVMRHHGNINSTYTGRCTVSSKVSTTL